MKINFWIILGWLLNLLLVFLIIAQIFDSLLITSDVPVLFSQAELNHNITIAGLILLFMIIKSIINIKLKFGGSFLLINISILSIIFWVIMINGSNWDFSYNDFTVLGEKLMYFGGILVNTLVLASQIIVAAYWFNKSK